MLPSPQNLVWLEVVELVDDGVWEEVGV